MYRKKQKHSASVLSSCFGFECFCIKRPGKDCVKFTEWSEDTMDVLASGYRPVMGAVLLIPDMKP